MFNNLKKAVALNKIATGAVATAVASTNSFALAATDVDMSSATSDITVVFIAMLGVAVLIFGYRKISGML